jgi:hypothetical protein
MGSEEGVAGVQELQNARLISSLVNFIEPGATPIRPTPHVATSPRFSNYSVERLPGLEKEAFGSVIFSFGVLSPLWHEANEIISPARTSRAAHLNSFRISNDSPTNSGCKSTKTRCAKSDSVALFYFGVFSISYG